MIIVDDGFALVFIIDDFQEEKEIHVKIEKKMNKERSQLRYDVDKETLKKHIRERQSAGQKGKNQGRKYRFFILQEYVTDETHEGDGDAEKLSLHKTSIVRAISSENAKLQYADVDMRNTIENDYGGHYAPIFGHSLIGNENGYPTKKEAQLALKELIKKGA